MCKGPGVDVSSTEGAAVERREGGKGEQCVQRLWACRVEEAVVGRGEGEGKNSVCKGPEADMRDGRKPLRLEWEEGAEMSSEAPGSMY